MTFFRTKSTMNKKGTGLTIATVAFFAGAVAVSFLPGCKQDATTQPADKARRGQA